MLGDNASDGILLDGAAVGLTDQPALTTAVRAGRLLGEGKSSIAQATQTEHGYDEQPLFRAGFAGQEA